MPPGYEPNAPNHPLPSDDAPEPTVIPVLQGFDVRYGILAKDDLNRPQEFPADHHIRELVVQVGHEGWYSAKDGDRVTEQGPGASITVGLRDNSGGFGGVPPRDESDAP